MENGLFPNVSQAQPRTLNKRTILDIVRFSAGGISRAELARQLGLTRSAMTQIVAGLLQEGLVREAASGPATGGRRPILLELNPQRGWVVGVDMGATHLSLVVADFLGHVSQDQELPFNIWDGPQACLDRLDEEVRRFLEGAGVPLEKVLAFGVGVPGPVVVESGMVSAPPIMPGWDSYPIRAYLEEKWNRPVSLNNDADLGALGEWAYGAAREKRHVIYIKVGSGVGAGLILDDRLYCGSAGLAGEIGHWTVQPEGPRCTCGNRGCLEALAGGSAIALQAQQAVRQGQRTQLSAVRPVENLNARHVGEAARLGDLVAQQIVAEAGRHIGVAVAGIVNLINPELVVVGGGVAQMGDLLLEPIRQAVQQRSLRPAAQAMRVTAAMLGRRSSGMGAVAQAIDLALCHLTAGNWEVKGGKYTRQETPGLPPPVEAAYTARSQAGVPPRP